MSDMIDRDAAIARFEEAKTADLCGCSHCRSGYDDAIEALRALPAVQPSPDVEPVAWRWESCANSQGWNTRYGCEKPEPSDYITDIVPLYAVQPSPDVAALVDADDIPELPEAYQPRNIAKALTAYRAALARLKGGAA